MKTLKRAAGLVVLRHIGGQWHCLVLRAYRNWDFPKGVPESGEDMLQAALRETAEETGLSQLEFPWGEDYRETAPYSNGKIARFYLASSSEQAVRLPVSAELGRPEHQEYRWVTPGEAKRLLPSRFWPILEWVEQLIRAPVD